MTTHYSKYDDVSFPLSFSARYSGEWLWLWLSSLLSPRLSYMCINNNAFDVVAIIIYWADHVTSNMVSS